MQQTPSSDKVRYNAIHVRHINDQRITLKMLKAGGTTETTRVPARGVTG